MDITWLGHAAIRVRTRTAAVVMEPAARSEGVDMGRPAAAIVTVSHDHPAHAHHAGVRGDPVVLTRPGEYEIEGVQLLGVSTRLAPARGDGDAEEPPPPRRNVVFVLEAELLRLAHLGGTGLPPTRAEIEQLSDIDVLVVPVGGESALAAPAAARLTRELDPRAVIPVCHQPANDGPGDELSAYLTALGIEVDEPVSRLTIQRRGLGETPRVRLLEPRG